MKTDSSWRCSNEVIEGWTQPDFVFPPDTFATANTLGDNTKNPFGPWGPRPGILADAQWIWALDSTEPWAGCRIEIDMQLFPTNAHLSSTSSQPRGAAKCIDGIKTTDPSGLSTDDQCHSFCNTTAPWLALEFAEPVEVTRVDIYNRGDECGGCAERTKNVEVRLIDELPTSRYQWTLYTGGQLLGTFSGPGKKGEIIKVEGPARTGRYVLVQMNNRDCLNLHEVEAFGRVANTITTTTTTTTTATTATTTTTTTGQVTGGSVKWVPAPITLLAILLLLF